VWKNSTPLQTTLHRACTFVGYAPTVTVIPSAQSHYTCIIAGLCSASYVGCQRDTARIHCWAPCSDDAAAGRRRCQSISPARTALSSKPAARLVCGRMMGQTDGRTDAGAFHRPCSAYYARSVNNGSLLRVTATAFVCKWYKDAFSKSHPSKMSHPTAMWKTSLATAAVSASSRFWLTHLPRLFVLYSRIHDVSLLAVTLSFFYSQLNTCLFHESFEFPL